MTSATDRVPLHRGAPVPGRPCTRRAGPGARRGGVGRAAREHSANRSERRNMQRAPRCCGGRERHRATSADTPSRPAHLQLPLQRRKKGDRGTSDGTSTHPGAGAPSPTRHRMRQAVSVSCVVRNSRRNGPLIPRARAFPAKTRDPQANVAHLRPPALAEPPELSRVAIAREWGRWPQPAVIGRHVHTLSEEHALCAPLGPSKPWTSAGSNAVRDVAENSPALGLSSRDPRVSPCSVCSDPFFAEFSADAPEHPSPVPLQMRLSACCT